jgi:hypothetical protein
VGREFTNAASSRAGAALRLRSSSSKEVGRLLCHLPSPLSTKLVIVLADLEDWKKLALMPIFSAME